MRITVFGATGSVGDWLIPEALRRGHEIVAVTRERSRMREQHSNLIVKEAGLDDPAALEDALAGSHAAIVVLGGAVVDRGTKAVVAAMRAAGVSRVEVLTGFGTSAASRRQLGLGMRLIVGVVRLLVGEFRIKERQDAAVRASGLEYTIVQPPTLTTAEATGTYRHGDFRGKSLMGSISRADLAAFMLDNLELGHYVNESVYVQQ